MMKSPKQTATPVTPSDDPREARTDEENRHEGFMPVEAADRINDEIGEEAKPWSDESEKMSVFDDHKEMMQGRQKV